MSLKADSCVHYNGMLGGDILDKEALRERRCKAGIRYADVKEDGHGRGLHIPCVDSLAGTLVCPSHEYPSAEQIAEEERQITAYLEKFASVMRGDLVECLTCGAAVERYKEVRPYVYAEPCGHRQWQGKAPPKKAATT